jgi:hypothetical protein
MFIHGSGHIAKSAAAFARAHAKVTIAGVTAGICALAVKSIGTDHTAFTAILCDTGASAIDGGATFEKDDLSEEYKRQEFGFHDKSSSFELGFIIYYNIDHSPKFAQKEVCFFDIVHFIDGSALRRT